MADERWTCCPKCGEQDTNCGALGGNDRCWHCDRCGFVECDHVTPDVLYLHWRRDLDGAPVRDAVLVFTDGFDYLVAYRDDDPEHFGWWPDSVGFAIPNVVAWVPLPPAPSLKGVTA